MKNKWWLAGFALGIVGAQACGPDFPLMLTTCRRACLEQIKSPGFVFDVTRMAEPVPEAPPAVEEDPIAAVSSSATGGPSEAKRLYDEGAKEFNRVHHSTSWGQVRDDEQEARPGADGVAADGTDRGFAEHPAADVVDEGLTAAIGWFERATALPPTDAEPRIVAATYMLARSHFLRHRAADEDIAVEQYRRTIELVEKGHRDDSALGNSAFGELGRIALAHERFAEAVTLYTRQLAGGSGHAVDSLWWVTRKIPDDSAMLEREFGDPLFQKFLLAYALSQADHTCFTEGSGECGDVYTRTTPEGRGPNVRLIVEALGKLDPKKVQWPDRAAALAYSIGDFAVATRLLKVADSPYAEWIRAKMALHAGDLEGAAQAFARASKSLTAARTADEMPAALVARMEGEHSLLLLNRSDYVEALYQLSVIDGYRDDANYVAERVLTVDELKSLVDKESWAESYRDLLARRLARADRFDEAIGYYSHEPVRSLAAKYAQARHHVVNASTRLAQARGWYLTAQLEMTSGMELTGTERCPDYSGYQGSFGSTCEQVRETVDELTSTDEINRVKGSGAVPDARFHYRDVAVAHLFQAADLLPRRSKIMSAVLCNGVAWLQQHGRSFNEELIQTVYERYLHDGRAEPWTRNFGATCAEPDFEH